jgi:hypothetical protein
MAEYYSVELAQKVRRGQKETRIKGNYCGGGIPYGYKVEKIDGNKKYVINDEEAAIVVRIFEEYAEGKICRDIIDGLTKEGIYARDGKPFGRCAIYGILQNERYTGVYRHKTDGVFFDTFPRIVPHHLFDAVRLIAENNKLGKNSTESPYLLRGKIKCGHCGASIRGDAGTSRTGDVLRYYACANHKKVKKKCKKYSLRKDDLEKLVIEVTTKVLSNPVNMEVLVDRIMAMNEKRSETNSTLIILNKEKTEISRAIDNMVKAIEQGVVTSTTRTRLQELETQLDEIKAKIRIEDAKAQLKLTKPEILKFINKAIRKEPAAMIRLLVKKVILFDEKIEIYYNMSERNRPDEDTHQAFSFYTEDFTYDSRAWWYTVKGGGATKMKIELFM